MNEIDELQKLVKSLQSWLEQHYNPMCSIVIDVDKVTVISRELSFPTEKESQQC